MLRSDFPQPPGLSSARVAVTLLAVAISLWAGSPLFAQLPLTELTHVFPAGGKQGTTFEVTVAGANQDGLQSLLFSHPGIAAKQKTQQGEFDAQAVPVNNLFEVSIAADVPPGAYEARVVGRFGASNPRAFAVGTLDEVLDDGKNKQVDTAQEVKVGTCVNGRVDASSRDYYKLPLKAGQRVLIECSAERLDSRMDATLVLMDATVNELLRCRDAIGKDPVLDFQAPADGDYLLSVYDFLYGGGADFVYRLEVHAHPHIDFVLPPAGLPGSNDQYTVYGRNLPGGKPAPDMLLDGKPLEQVTTRIQLPSETGSDLMPVPHPRTAFIPGVSYQLQQSKPVFIGLARAPVVSEKEPNNEASQAQQVSLPCECAGQFYPARDDDWYEFTAKQGEVYWIEVISHQLGLESDPYIMLQRVTKNEQGEESVSDVAQMDDPSDRNTRIGSNFDTSTDDPSYRFQVPAEGTYRLMVRDQFGSGQNDPRNVYRLVIRPERPDFRLVAVAEQIKVANANQVLQYSPVLRQGGTTLLKLMVQRLAGFDGEIEVSAEGLPNGVHCDGAVLGGNVSDGWLVFRADAKAAPWVGPVQLVGKARIGDQDVVRPVRGGTLLWGTTNRTQIAPAFRAARDMVLSVIDKDQAVALVQVGDAKVLETSRGGKLEVPVKVTRYGDFKADLKLVATGMPKEIKPADITVKGNAGDGKLAFAITNNNAKPGSYTFFLRGDTKVKRSRNPDAIAAAEQQQKHLEATVKQVNEEAKKVQAERDAAVKAAQDAANAAKQAGDQANKAEAAAKQKPDEKALADQAVAARKNAEQQQSKAQAAEQAKAQAEQKLKDMQEKAKRATAAKAAADKSLADAKKNNAAKDINVTVVSTPIKLRIAASPVQLASSESSAKQGEQVEIPVSVTRAFGFEDNVDITFEPPKGVGGLSAAKLTVAKGQTEGKLKLTVAKNAPAGEHAATLRGRLKFNNVNIDTTTPLVVKVAAAE